MRRLCLLLVASVLTLAAAVGAHAAAMPPFQVVMSGLDNPRGLAFGPDGALYVAEAGRGGTSPCGLSPIVPGPDFAGPTGAISRLFHGVQKRVVTGLPSRANPDGSFAFGPHHVAIRGRGGFVSIGLGDAPSLRPACGPVGPQFATLVRFSANGSWRVVADLGAYEQTANPDNGVIETDPYGLLVEPGALVATDAAGNSLLRVGANGSISTIAIFPSRAQGRSTDSVPTTVAVRRGNDESDDDDNGNSGNSGNNGDNNNNGDHGRQTYYVGELTGDPFVPGTANIYRVVPGQGATVWKTGFSFIIDMAFARDGSLYVLEFGSGPGLAPPGDLWRIAPDGTRSLVATGFVAPNGLAIGPDGAIYVSQFSIFPGTGQVVRITP